MKIEASTELPTAEFLRALAVEAKPYDKARLESIADLIDAWDAAASVRS